MFSKLAKATRALLLVMAACAPWLVRRLMLGWLCGARFGRGAYVGNSYVDVRKLVLADRARIGSLTIFRDVAEVSLEGGAAIGNLNWFTGSSHKTAAMVRDGQPPGRLCVREGGAITNRHYVDVHADIIIGRMALVAGVRCTLLTHSIDLAANCQTTAGIAIGDYTFVGTNSVMLPGAQVPERCVIAAGSVVRGSLAQAGWLYGGVPAKPIKAIAAGPSSFFHRTESFVR